jgi:hypothetical protein
MEQVIKMLVKQLIDRGMTEGEISACIGSLWNIILDPHVKCSEDFNLKMSAAGWENIELNDKAFKMVSSSLTI